MTFSITKASMPSCCIHAISGKVDIRMFLMINFLLSIPFDANTDMSAGVNLVSGSVSSSTLTVLGPSG